MTELVPAALLSDIRQLIDAGHRQTAAAVNPGLVQVYWQVGRRIRQDVLDDERAEYGREIIASLSARLMAEYGGGSPRETCTTWSRWPNSTTPTRLCTQCVHN